MQQGKRSVPNMTIYVTEEQKERMKKLTKMLDANGVTLRDNRGNLSVSALIRHLTDEKLAALAARPRAVSGDSEQETP